MKQRMIIDYLQSEGATVQSTDVKDIERFISALIKAFINPVEEVPNIVTCTLLSASTAFVIV